LLAGTAAQACFSLGDALLARKAGRSLCWTHCISFWTRLWRGKGICWSKPAVAVN